MNFKKDPKLQPLAQSNNLFANDIYKEAIKTKTKSTVISPFALQTALAFTQSGSKDETGAQIRTSLHLPSTPKEVTDLYSYFVPKLFTLKGCLMRHTNVLYVKNNLPVVETFKKSSEERFHSKVENVDFNRPTDAVNTINVWINDRTNTRVQGVVEPTDVAADSKVVVINGLYFRGPWLIPFEEKNTKKLDFYKTPKDKVQVDTMINECRYDYCEDTKLNAKFLSLKYDCEGVAEAAMIFVLPNKKDGLSAIENQIDQVLAVSNFTKEDVTVHLPKFHMEEKFVMRGMLEKLGMQKAFNSGADFSGLAGKKGDLFISNVVQKVYMEIDEIGTDSRGMVYVKYAGEGPGKGEKKEFIADHPFLFYIKLENLVLFVGRYNGSTEDIAQRVELPDPPPF